MRCLLMFIRNILVVLLISSLLSCGASITQHTLDTQPIRESGPFQYPAQVNSEANSQIKEEIFDTITQTMDVFREVEVWHPSLNAHIAMNIKVGTETKTMSVPTGKYKVVSNTNTVPVVHKDATSGYSSDYITGAITWSALTATILIQIYLHTRK